MTRADSAQGPAAMGPASGDQGWPWPPPIDDGAARHLVAGTPLPPATLGASTGPAIDLARLPCRSVVFVYPWTGRPGLANPPDWDDIPGAHGSTPQAEGFRDLHAEFTARGIAVFGLSGQDGAHHRELAERLRLPFPLLSDTDLGFARALRLPTFATGGITYLKRLTLLIADGHIRGALYPVHPPDRSAADALAQAERIAWV